MKDDLDDWAYVLATVEAHPAGDMRVAAQLLPAWPKAVIQMLSSERV